MRGDTRPFPDTEGSRDVPSAFPAPALPRISATLVRLQDTTAKIRNRAAFLLLAFFIVLAEQLELEAISARSSPAR